jgi:hypothetical protein
MSALRSATLKAWMAFVLTAVVLVLGSAVFVGATPAAAQDDEVVTPDSASEASEGPNLIAPAPDATQEPGVVEPAPAGGPDEEVIAPAPQGGTDEGVVQPAPADSSEDELIAPAPAEKGQSDDGGSALTYGLLALGGVAVLAGAAVLTWRLRAGKA